MTDFLVLPHAAIPPALLGGLRALFDAEYLPSHGRWDPDGPYGYAPADWHVVATGAGGVLGHTGFQLRTIAVGDLDVPIAGTGGVLVAPQARGTGLGSALLRRAQEAMRTTADFGYLGCREELAPFYQAAGWRRVHVAESHVALDGAGTVVVQLGSPILICSAAKRAADWPAGPVDLKGKPW